jgi:hypothetical protein
MKSAYSTALFIALTTLALLPRPAQAEPPQELRKLHALLVIDTRTDLRDSVLIDGERVKHMLVCGIPKDRLELTVFRDKDVTTARILEYYKAHKVGSTDAMLFYYAGHGATDPQKGHWLALQELHTAPLVRADLRAAMQQHRPGLSIILSDCCSDRLKIPNPPQKNFRAVDAGSLDPVLRCLFFQHRGIVDITASTDNVAYGDDHDGGLFTRALVSQVKKGRALLDKNRDNFVSWAEIFPRVRAETEGSFDRWSLEARRQGKQTEQNNQKPRAFSLGDNQSLTIVNQTKKAVKYQHRWEGETEWETTVLPPEGAHAHAPHKGGNDAPGLEVKFETGETGVFRPGKSYRYFDGKKTRNVNED